MNRFVENMRAVARLQDQWMETSDMGAQVRQRLLPSRAVTRSPVTRAVWLSAAGGALALAAGVALLWQSNPPELTFSVGAAQRAELGKWVSAPDHQALPLTFSDGTHITLQRSTQARVTELTAQGAHLVLERGSLEALVVHRTLAHWELQAGPFAVLVRGTQFTLNWSPESSTLVVELAKGLVDVVGPGLGGPRSVKAGERLRVSAEATGWHVEATDVTHGATTSEPHGPDAVLPSEGVQDAPGGSSAVTTNPAKEPATSKPGWQELAAVGNYVDSLATARRLGVQRICASGSVGELTKLAQVARLAGDAETARTALRSVRERFAGSAEAAMATFDLGRLAFDTSGRFLEAAHWFKDYLREFPHGRLAREATGRLIESLERGGDHTGACEVANEYLLKYPSGPHAGLAHRLLNR
jgi:TolA-binding protein